MANLQSDQDSGVVSYGDPDAAALASMAKPAAAPAQAQYNSIEDFDKTFPPAQSGPAAAPVPQQFNSIEDFDKAYPPGGQTAPTVPEWAQSLQRTAQSITKTLDAFTGGTTQAETQDLGLSEDTQNDLRKWGIYNDYAKGEMNYSKSMLQAVLNPLVATADAAMRLPVAPIEGAAQAAEAQGADRAARDIRLLPNLLMEHFTLPTPVAAARSEGVIGEGEAGFMGTKEQTPEDTQARAISGSQIPQPTDIHAAARQIAPDTFNEYDALSDQRELLGNQLRELSTNRPADIEASAPHTQEIADLQERLAGQDLSERKTARLQDRLDQLTKANQVYIEGENAKVSPDIENVRQAYEAVDSRMRDMSPDVTAAYRAAQERIPQAQAVAETIPDAKGIVSTEPTQGLRENPPTGLAEPTQEIPRDEDMLRAITEDASKKMQSTGTQPEVAEAAGRLIAENYQSVAEQFGGRKGTARDLYDQGLKIVPARGAVRARVPELAQQYDRTAAGEQSVIPGAEKISDKELAERKMEQPLKAKVAQQPADEGLFGDAHKQDELFSGNRGSTSFSADGAQAVMKLFKAQNASTPVHELGHIWLNNLLRFAADEQAPAQMVRDAATVRKWLGVEGDATMRERNENGDFLYRDQHEKFARGIERYLMEGHAPSRALDGVFARFKAWMLNIYNTVRRQAKLSDLSPDVRNVFDRLLAAKPERTVIAPERETDGLFGRAPSAEVEGALPEQAPDIAEGIKAGRRAIAETHVKEDVDEINRGTTPETEGRPAGGTESNGAGNASGRPEAQTGDLQVSPSSGDNRGKTSSQGNKASGVYQPVPRKPLTLLDWVRNNGGIRDEGGDVTAALGNGIKGLIRPKAGMNIDDMALKAWEEGYFHEKGATRPTVNEFLDKLIQDRTTKDQYSAHDQVAMDAYNDAIQRNAEADKIAGDLGIETVGKTHEEFWNEVREKMSIEDQARMAAEQAAANQKIFEETEKAKQEFLASRGKAWEPDEVKTRSLQDLENEHQQETASRKPFASDDSAGESGSAAADQGRVQEVGGRSGRSVGTRPEPTDSGNAGGDAGESVLDEKGNPKYDLIEKRIEKINTPDDVDNFIREAAKENDAFSDARRGVVSQAQTIAMAEAMGVDGNFYSVMQTRKVGEAYNAHQLKAAEALFHTLSVDAYEKSKLPKTPENMAAFTAANQKFLMATSHFMAASTEAGRALNILRTMSAGLKSAKDINEFFQKNSGMTANDIGKQMDFMSKLDNEANQAAFIQASKKASFRDMMLEYYVNCLLSGPFTHMRYMIGNAIKAIETPLIEIPLAAAHADYRQLITGKVDPDRVYWGEAGAQLYALGKGARDGLQAGATAWKTGQSPWLPGEVVRQFRPNAIPGRFGDVINVPSTMIEGIHGFSKTLRYTQNIAGLAYREAMREGLQGEDFNLRVAELTKTPTEAMMNDATENALKELYMAPADYNSLSGMLVRVTNSNALAKIVVPFMKIGTQITKEAFLERSPLGIAFSKDVRDNIMGKNGGAARDMQTAKIVTGTALMGATAAMVMEGNATGDGPNDPKQRAEWLLTHRPNTITVGDITIPYQGLGSLGMLMRFAANMTETAHAWNEEDGGKLAISFLEGISKSVLDDNWMRGVKDLLDAIYHPQDYGARYVQNMATNWLPFSVGLGQVSRAIDPSQREVRSHGMENGFGLLDAICDRIPGESETLLPRRDIFGEPIPNGGQRNYLNDPVVARMDALRIFPSPLQRKIRGVELTDQQYDDYSRIAGVSAKMRLNQVVGMPQFNNLAPKSQIETIDNTIKIYREQARTAVMMKYPDIMQQATAAKRKDQRGGNP